MSNVFRMGERVLGMAPHGYAPVSPPESPRQDSPPAPLPRPRRSRRSRRPGNVTVFFVSFLVYLIGIFPTLVFALPQSPTVQSGSVSIEQPTQETMNVIQSTQKAIIDWQSFSIAGGEHVDFQLSHGASGVTLNRVTGDDPSAILGMLTSNGKLMLINRNGIMFGKDAIVDVNGLVATTSDISNADFLAGNYQFKVAPQFSASVTNQGLITAAQGGFVALVAPGVVNDGIINARLGQVSLAGANTFTLDLYGDQLVNLGVDSTVLARAVGVDGQALDALVNHSGSIYADGGIVQLDVRAAQGVVDRVINMDGIIEARSVDQKNGKIVLSGGPEGNVVVNGTLNASGYNPGETGGTVHVLGKTLWLLDNTLADVSGDLGGGELLVGGDYQGKNPAIQNATDTYVTSGAQFFADAVTSGNGGRTIFWADRRNVFLGRIQSRGGRLFGDGGFAEVSGKEELYFDGRVDLSAENGRSGTLLLDPTNVTVASGSPTSGASGSVTFDISGNQFTISNAVLASGDDITIFETTLEAVASTSNIIITADSTITIGNMSDNALSLATAGGNSVTFETQSGNIEFSDTSDTLSTAGGDIILTAGGSLTIGSLSSSGGDITLTGSDLTLGGTINSGAGTTTIVPRNSGFLASTPATLGLGDATGTMTISGTELGNITAANLVLGDSTNSSITVNNVTAANSNNISGTLTLNAKGDDASVTFTGAASTFNALAVNADNGIIFNVNVTTDTGNLALEADVDNASDGTDSITLASGVALTSAGSLSLDATTGGISGAGTGTLSAVSGVTINDSFTSTGALTINADSDGNGAGTFTLASSKSITASNAALSITAEDIDLSGTLSSGTGNTSLIVSDGGTISLGGTSGGMKLSGTELGNITTTGTGTLVIGSSSAGAITIESDVTPSNASNVHLTSGSTVTGTAGGIV
ncbi:MAG: hypothetical protein COV67_11920, partial [Nitrospinae bacterium CG11_big_fil_rev_8_21_14_0_20_56_8]